MAATNVSPLGPGIGDKAIGRLTDVQEPRSVKSLHLQLARAVKPGIQTSIVLIHGVVQPSIVSTMLLWDEGWPISASTIQRIGGAITSPRSQRIAAGTPPNRLTTQRRVAAGRAAMRMGATVMRHGSDQYLTAAMSGMVICMVLLGAILARSVGLAEPRGQVFIASEQREQPTDKQLSVDDRPAPEKDGRFTLDIGLRGSLP